MIEATVVRIAEAGKLAFVLRKGEDGISVFERHAVNHPLSDTEILEAFRVGSQLLARPISAIVDKGLELVMIEGASTLPRRLQEAHREIRPGSGMDRAAFKKALRELE